MIPKRGDLLSTIIDRVLRIVTFGGQDRYLSEYHTVLGDTLYLPEAWDHMSDAARLVLLRHERVHLRQRRRYTLVGMAIIYLLPIFPVGLALGRALLEWEAYVETLRATAEVYGPGALESPSLREGIIRRFTGPDYAFMWPFRSQVERWYARAVAEIRATERLG
jgi:hypothetical protein